MRNILVCTGGWKGDRYKSSLMAVKPQFEAYASACGSDMAVIDYALDPKGRRSIFTQKLLIPRAFSHYEIVVHIDLDVLLPRTLPNIFSSVPDNAGFAAVVDPRESYAFQKNWGFADWTTRSHRFFFEKLGLTSAGDLATINAGVVAFRPRLIAGLFEAWYFDDNRYRTTTQAEYSSEEIPMAYLSQDNGLFAPLDYCFNRQVCYALHETPQGKVAYAKYRSASNRIRRKIRKSLGMKFHHVGFGHAYQEFVEDMLRNGNLVHFAGKYPIPAVNPELLMTHAKS